MGRKKITGIPEIDAIAAALSKKFGDKEILSLGPKIETPEVSSSGSLSLDALLGCGGIPNNRIIEVYGPPSAGKTSLSLQIAREFRAKFGDARPIVFIDLERTTGLDLITSMGLDPNKMIFCYPDTAEEALQIAKDLGLSGAVGMVIFDSVDAAQTERDTKRLMSEVGVADLPRIMSKAMRSLSKICVDKEVLYLMLNQTRTNVGQMFGNPEKTSGGIGLEFYSSMRLRVASKPSPNQENTLLMKVRIVKNKLAPALNRTAEFDFVCGKGTDMYQDLLNYAKDIGLLRFAGSAVKITDEAGEETTLCTGGKLGAKQYLIDNPTIYENIKRRCLGQEDDTRTETSSEEVTEISG